MKTEPDNSTPPTAPPAPARASMASSSPASRPFVLATLRALRLDPGCGCRAPKTRRIRPENGHYDHKPALTGSAASGMTPRDWLRSCMRHLPRSMMLQGLASSGLSTAIVVKSRSYAREIIPETGYRHQIRIGGPGYFQQEAFRISVAGLNSIRSASLRGSNIAVPFPCLQPVGRRRYWFPDRCTSLSPS